MKVYAEELEIGDQVFTPAYRWETVTGLADWCKYRVRVCTDQTAEAYAWVFMARAEVEVIRDRPPLVAAVRVTETAGTMTAHVGTEEVRTGYCAGAHVLVEASQVIGGRGWEVSHRPDGGDLEITRVAGKAQARSLVRRHARNHARALGLQLVVEGPAR